MNPVRKTQQTYDQIAQKYAEVRANRQSLARQMTRFVDLLPRGGRVADIGCGPAYDSRLLQQQGLQTVGVDLSLGMLWAAKKILPCPPLVQADMRHLPFGQSFAGLWLCASLLHIPRPQVPAVLANCHRLLQPSGIMLLTLKGGEGEAWHAQSYGEPVPRFFTFWQPDQLDDLLQTAAFTIIDGWQQSQNGVNWLTRICRKEAL